MGLFGGKKKTYVSSVVYPLGEDGEKRTDMLKNTVLNAVLQDKSIAESIREGYLRGQGISLKNSFLYARDKYTNGVPTSAARYTDRPNLESLAAVLQGMHPGAEVSFVTTLLGSADFTWWAERYLAETYGYDRVTQRFDAPPLGVEATANVAYNYIPDGQIQILLMNADGATQALAFRPDGFIKMANYTHCAYQTSQTFEGGTTTTTRPAAPDEQARTTYSSETVDRAGETQITTTKTEVSLSGSTATVTVSLSTEVVSRPKYFLYQLGTGKYPTLDAQLVTTQLTAPYYPSVPVRVNNNNWTGPQHQKTDLFKTSDKLLKKVGLDLADIGKKVQSNENINEIDYCFVAFGVQLNTKSPEGKRYVFRFLNYLRSISTATPAQYSEWVDDYNSSFPKGPAGMKLPAGGIQAPPTNSVEIYSTKDRANNHDVKLQWQYIDSKLVAGQVRPGARIGDVEILSGAKVQFNLLSDMILDGSRFLARRQVDENTFEELTVIGLTYENFIYQGHSVIVTAQEALSDPDNEGFVLPLNQEIVRATPLVELTNLSFQCMFLIFNCYKVVKQKWYQTTIFQIIVVIIAIVITVLSWGSAGPAAGGMVSATLATAGAAIGLTGLILAIAVATVMVLGTMVLMSVLTDAATQLFGAKWGALIGAIASIIAMNYANSLGAAAGSAASQSTVFTAQNIIAASSAVVQTYVQDQLKGISQEMDKLASDYKTGMAKVEELTKEYLSTNLDLIDVQGITQASWTMNYELADTFLGRTLMTGSDICAVTSGMIENFTDIGLQLPGQG